jgi:hypothetical protein
MKKEKNSHDYGWIYIFTSYRCIAGAFAIKIDKKFHTYYCHKLKYDMWEIKKSRNEWEKMSNGF